MNTILLFTVKVLNDVKTRYFGKNTVLGDVDGSTDKIVLCKLMLNSHNLKHCEVSRTDV